MKVYLVGFVQESQTRLFTFKCVAADRETIQVAVAVDMSLALKYDIPVQDLPAICRRLVETTAENEVAQSGTLEESEMIAIQAAALAAAPARKARKLPPRTQYMRPPTGSNTTGEGARDAAKPADGPGAPMFTGPSGIVQ